MQNIVFGATSKSNFVKIKHIMTALLGFGPKTYMRAPKITAPAKKSTWSCYIRKSAEKLAIDNIIA